MEQEYANKCFNSFENEDDDGSVFWERVMVKDPTGALVQIFMGPGKFQKQVRTEILTKRLGNIIRGEGICQADAKRYSGEVLVSWQPLALAVVKSKDDGEPLWDAMYRDKLGTDKERVTGLSLAPSPSQPEQWSS